MVMDSLLVISEEPALADTLASELPELSVLQARGKELAARLQERAYRLIILDEGSGTEAIADAGKTPVIRLTRPASLSELLYTIRERLQGKSAAERDEVALADGLTFSPQERLVRSGEGNTHIALTEKETELLQCLLDADGGTVARDILLKEVWGYSDDIATHTLETHIYRLRGKLRQASESLDIVSSEEGGYVLKL
jgi:DNA-binding response OmpR family regulator